MPRGRISARDVDQPRTWTLSASTLPAPASTIAVGLEPVAHTTEHRAARVVDVVSPTSHNPSRGSGCTVAYRSTDSHDRRRSVEQGDVRRAIRDRAMSAQCAEAQVKAPA